MTTIAQCLQQVLLIWGWIGAPTIARIGPDLCNRMTKAMQTGEGVSRSAVSEAGGATCSHPTADHARIPIKFLMEHIRNHASNGIDIHQIGSEGYF
eukprot:3034782-Amphidinium_carterae.2